MKVYEKVWLTSSIARAMPLASIGRYPLGWGLCGAPGVPAGAQYDKIRQHDWPKLAVRLHGSDPFAWKI